MLYAFDLLELNGKDLRPLPLGDRKAKLERLLAGVGAGIVFNEHTDQEGAIVLRHACKLGLEGIVSKRLTAPYRSGPSRDWIKVKNPESPAMIRHREIDRSRAVVRVMTHNRTTANPARQAMSANVYLPVTGPTTRE